MKALLCRLLGHRWMVTNATRSPVHSEVLIVFQSCSRCNVCQISYIPFPDEFKVAG